MTVFVCNNMPEVDQREIKCGRCPWCLGKLMMDHVGPDEADYCPECDDTFVGQLTIED